MKYIVILGDGMADEEIGSLGGMTPLQYADTPNMDYIAREGRCGMLKTVPDGFEPGSDVANLSVIGYDPTECYTGRGPLEAVNMGVELGDEDIAYRCNLVTIKDHIMQDFSAGHISSEEGRQLIAALNKEITGAVAYPGISYRNLLVVKGGKCATTVPPHDIVEMKIDEFLPEGSDRNILLECMESSGKVFENHPVNMKRIKKGLKPATGIWPWSGGKKPILEPFERKFGLKGGMISAVDLLNGIARAAGMKVISVPGATGYLDTDYDAKMRYALDAIRDLDYIYVHVEAPDEAGHLGDIEEKVKAIERLDRAVGMVLDEFDGIVAALPDHPTPIRLKTHTSDPVPFAILGKGKDSCSSFSEKEAQKGSFGLLKGQEFIRTLIS